MRKLYDAECKSEAANRIRKPAFCCTDTLSWMMLPALQYSVPSSPT